VNPDALEPRRHGPPEGWPPETFEQLTDALATALVVAAGQAAVNPTIPNSFSGDADPD
jgi:hypothetical protein